MKKEVLLIEASQQALLILTVNPVEKSSFPTGLTPVFIYLIPEFICSVYILHDQEGQTAGIGSRVKQLSNVGVAQVGKQLPLPVEVGHKLGQRPVVLDQLDYCRHLQLAVVAHDYLCRFSSIVSVQL